MPFRRDMNTIIEWFKDQTRNTQIAIAVAVCVFTPAVSIVLSILVDGIGAAFSVIGFILSLLNWKGVLFIVMVCAVLIARASYTWVMDEDGTDTELEDDTFSW
jgi:DMSO/TMAO reductase YedYZ heme-binding membrane subunit